MNYVRAKKSLGQHFLKDKNIAQKIVGSLLNESTCNVLEIGPGTGVLTQFLLEIPALSVKVVEIDKESVIYLNENYPELENRIIAADFLKQNLDSFFEGKFSVIGNFPYNISSQIFFKILDNREIIPEVVCMLQKEVAERICSEHGKKTYGILSVLLQSYYDLEYLFTVNENVFIPPPKVKSAVVRLVRKQKHVADCDQDFLAKVVKAAFNQRRKMLRNSLKQLRDNIPVEYETLRPEQLSVSQFIELTKLLSN